MPSTRQIPYSEEAELGVLASMVLSDEAQSKAFEHLVVDDFYNFKHRIIFEALRKIYQRGDAIDAVTLIDQVKSQASLEDAGGIRYVSQLFDYVPSDRNVEHYCKIVREKSLARNLIDSAKDIINSVEAAETGEIESLIDFAETKIFNVAERVKTAEVRNVRDALGTTFESIKERIESERDIVGIPTGLPPLDAKLSGFRDGQLIIVAGRPSMGKSSLATNFLQHAALREDKTCAIFSLEMSEQEIIERILASEARVNSRKLQIGDLNKDEHERLRVAANELKRTNIFIDDSAYLTPLEVRAKARRLAKEQSVDMIMVDYLQLMHVSDHSGNREQEISTISRSLKALAKELQIPVVALSQLSRSCETRANKRPILSDLRESGAIEQDADVVLFIFREEVYTGHMNDQGENVSGLAELIVSKQRNGPTGTVNARFLSDYTTFEVI